MRGGTGLPLNLRDPGTASTKGSTLTSWCEDHLVLRWGWDKTPGRIPIKHLSFPGGGVDQGDFDPHLGQPSDRPLLCPAVSLELGDVSLVSVPPEGLQPAPNAGSRGQLIAQLQELLHHWVLWSAVKSRWVIVGKWALHSPSPISQCLPAPEMWRTDSPRPFSQRTRRSWEPAPCPTDELEVRDPGSGRSLSQSLTPSLQRIKPVSRQLSLIEHLLRPGHHAGQQSRVPSAWALALDQLG